jgi:hypothetical protein
VEDTYDNPCIDTHLTFAGSDGCTTAGGGAGAGVALALALLGRGRPPRWRPRRRAGRGALLVLAVCLVPALAAPASAQPSGSRAIGRLHPAAPDSEWFALDSVGFVGHSDVSVGITGDYGYRPLVIYNADGSRRADIVRHQLILHFAGSVTLFERFRLSATAPLAPYQDGDATQYNAMPLPGPTYAFGDTTVAGDVRITGDARSALRVAAGVNLVFPTGSRTNYMSDGVFAGDAHLLAAGTLGHLEYAVDGRLLIREETDLAGENFGSEFRFAAAAGLRLASSKLVIGPELMGALPLMSGLDVHHPLEIGLGLHYRAAASFRFGVGGTRGLFHEVGTPEERVMASAIWLP